MSEPIIGTCPSVTGETLEKRLWLPEGRPRAVLQLVHGMAEYIARYDETAKRLNEAGFAVVGHDLLGHGPGAKTLGWFAERDGWDALEQDIHTLRLQTQAEYPSVPYFLLGHSMGSFLVRTYSQKWEAGLAGIILSGTAHFDPLLLNSGLLIANLQCLLGMEKKPSKLLHNMSFGGYNKPFMPARTAFDWLSTNNDNVDRYVADPLCGFPFTAGAYRDLFHGLKRLYPKNLATMDKNVPVRLISGALDPVGACGASVKTTAKELVDAGVKNVTWHLYPEGRHEMLNELQREQVWSDLIEWMEQHV
jgi:alpha-beta hydrolase superfamily lysophospholipase